MFKYINTNILIRVLSIKTPENCLGRETHNYSSLFRKRTAKLIQGIRELAFASKIFKMPRPKCSGSPGGLQTVTCLCLWPATYISAFCATRAYVQRVSISVLCLLVLRVSFTEDNTLIVRNVCLVSHLQEQATRLPIAIDRGVFLTMEMQASLNNYEKLLDEKKCEVKSG